MVEAVTRPSHPAQLPALEPFLAQLPLLPAAAGLRDAAALLQAHYVVDPVALEPREEPGPTEAPVGQDYRTNPRRKRPNHGQKRLLLELVLALTRGEGIPIVSQLQKRQGPPLSGHGDAQDLVAHPFAGGESSVEEGPVDGQPQEPRVTQEPSDHMRNEGRLDRQRVDPLIVGEAPQPLEAVQQVMLRSCHSALVGGRVGPGLSRRGRGCAS